VTQALATQQTRDALTPEELSVGGRRAIDLELTVPGMSTTRCVTSSTMNRWSRAGRPPRAPYHQGPGQRDRVWLIHVDGVLLIVDVAA
jgi:hypothetical protein